MDEWDEILAQLDLENVEIMMLPDNEPDFKFEYAHESISEKGVSILLLLLYFPIRKRRV